MQNYAFIPSLGLAPGDFWKIANDFGRKEKMDSVLAYMYAMLRGSEKGLAQPRTLGSLLPRGKSDQKRAQGGGDSPLRIPLLICLVYARGTVCPA